MYDTHVLGNSTKLPYTGIGALTVGGVVIDQLTMVVIALALVGVGALLVRFGWRRNKAVSDQ